jgi:uncharacterized repeat protein (TIGR01451 family)
MKTLNTIKRSRLAQTSVAALLLASFAMYQSAYAAGTAANTDITNTAVINYTVGGVAQTPLNSNTSTFKVDRKVDLTVNAGVATSTTPGATDVGVIYTVTNTGNGTDSFTFAATNQPGDNFDVSSLRVYRDNGATPNVFDAGDTLITAGTPVSFNADEQIRFFIVSNIPLTAANGQNGIVRLAATTVSTQTVGVDNPLAVDVVFADAGSDGTEAANNQYNIAAPTLAVVKSAAIISDPVNLTGANRKAIPGAVIEYTVVVTNSGAASAAAVALSDNVPANTTYVPGSMTLNAAALTDANDADAGTFTGTAVNVNAGTVNGSGGTATVQFRVTLN